MFYDFSMFVDEGLEVSSRFTHLFQVITTKEDGINPLIQISAAENK